MGVVTSSMMDVVASKKTATPSSKWLLYYLSTIPPLVCQASSV